MKILQNAYLLFTCKDRRRYNRKRAKFCRNFAKIWQLPYGSAAQPAVQYVPAEFLAPRSVLLPLLSCTSSFSSITDHYSILRIGIATRSLQSPRIGRQDLRTKIVRKPCRSRKMLYQSNMITCFQKSASIQTRTSPPKLGKVAKFSQHRSRFREC